MYVGVARIFVGGASGPRHPVLNQWWTHLKLSLEARDL